ncbi:flavin reductase family protein [Biformimicrobium ophioploci]|uniref:Flavin reductase family protein n=1 Tax=Biformimicrobium ophioploci TaxID=3036711 RepID=A0ABQ6LWL9_9GAMM|nr:flavin reductase family protein [Microbulbifer sp. NKW57]GMG86478.1 flavin reductase family protein [Microbulbifer sp. NKW57]
MTVETVIKPVEGPVSPNSPNATETAPAIDPRALRSALGQFPTGVTVVTALDPQGQPVGMTASSFNAVSLDPALVLWSISHDALSYPVFSRCEHFAIHVLKREQQHLSDLFASRGADKFGQCDWRPGLAGLPLLDDSAALFQCRAEHRYPGGDHTILVGRVLALSNSGGEPLVFHGGNYGAVAR